MMNVYYRPIDEKNMLNTTKSIYGGIPTNPAAYCKLHDGTLTPKEMKRKECLKKQCRHLEKYTDHEFWKQRNAQKQRKAETLKG